MLLACLACASNARDPVTLEGRYEAEVAVANYALEFEHGKCFAPDHPDHHMVESPCFMRGSLLYIQPAIPKDAKMSRNVFVVYELRGDRLEARYIEDVDDGSVFYRDKQNKPVLVKAQPARGSVK